MYYAKADIDNDGNIDDIVRFDMNRMVIYRDAYRTHIVTFRTTTPPFKFIDQNITKLFKINYIYDIFFYKNKTYIKELAYGLIDAGFMYMYIKGFDKNQELVPLCLITADKKQK
jgi:hypothetical protein